MGWQTSIDSSGIENKYWIADILPQPTIEWNTLQAKKSYILPDGTVRKFPGWYYDNGSHVDDDYLFYNEGWKLLLDNEPQLGLGKQVQIELKPQEDWDYSEEKIVKKTYWERLIIDIPPDHDPRTHKVVSDPDHFWEKTDISVTRTYQIVEKTEEEKKFDENKMWWELRDTRNKKLTETDWIFIRAQEQKLEVNPDVLKYRQDLRDLPSTVTDIYSVAFPTEPTNFFV